MIDPTAPSLNIHDIAKAVGVKPQCLTGDISTCLRLDLELKDGRTLRLQTGDTPDHYWVAIV